MRKLVKWCWGLALAGACGSYFAADYAYRHPASVLGRALVGAHEAAHFRSPFGPEQVRVVYRTIVLPPEEERLAPVDPALRPAGFLEPVDVLDLKPFRLPGQILIEEETTRPIFQVPGDFGQTEEPALVVPPGFDDVPILFPPMKPVSEDEIDVVKQASAVVPVAPGGEKAMTVDEFWRLFLPRPAPRSLPIGTSEEEFVPLLPVPRLGIAPDCREDKDHHYPGCPALNGRYPLPRSLPDTMEARPSDVKGIATPSQPQ